MFLFFLLRPEHPSTHAIVFALNELASMFTAHVLHHTLVFIKGSVIAQKALMQQLQPVLDILIATVFTFKFILGRRVFGNPLLVLDLFFILLSLSCCSWLA